jgi:phosphoribosylformylglycinamidine synthase
MQTGRISGKAPEIDLDVEWKRQAQLLEAIQKGLVESAHDVAEGGVAVALAECVMKGNIGASVVLEGDENGVLFGESQSRFLVTVKPERAADFEKVMSDAVQIGFVRQEPGLAIDGAEGRELVKCSHEELEKAWRGAIPCLLTSKA